MRFARSEFDSDVLGLPVAKLSANLLLTEETVDSTLSACAAQGFKLVFWSPPHSAADLIAFAQRSGHFCSSKITYRAFLNESLLSIVQQGAGKVEICEYNGTDSCDELFELSQTAGGNSRFQLDPNISVEQFESVYSTWMQNCVNHRVADVVLTARMDSLTVGMVTLKLDPQTESTSIVLLAVHEEYRRLGIGKALVAAAFRWTLDIGLAVCTVVTQETNLSARKLYERCGALEMSRSTDFHFWLSSTPFNDPVNSSIPQNKPYMTGNELVNLEEIFKNEEVATHGKYGKMCQEQLESELGALKALLVTSGTSALELCSLAIGVQPGDEIIMPSYTFVSTASAFVNHGGVPVFVDIRRDTQNIDETKIINAITDRTKAIVVVHYAGVPCEMDTIMEIAARHKLRVIEDNAHGIFSMYKGKPLGTFGDLAAHSFHYTKNLSCGEGGAVIVNAPDLVSPCMVAWEKGTNRFDFLTGKVDKYAWVDRGSSFVLSEINAAVLAAQAGECVPPLIVF